MRVSALIHHTYFTEVEVADYGEKSWVKLITSRTYPCRVSILTRILNATNGAAAVAKGDARAVYDRVTKSTRPNGTANYSSQSTHRLPNKNGGDTIPPPAKHSVQAMPAWLMKTRWAPSRHCRQRVYSLITGRRGSTALSATAMGDKVTSPTPPPQSPTHEKSPQPHST